jgi:hypothetical protein
MTLTQKVEQRRKMKKSLLGQLNGYNQLRFQSAFERVAIGAEKMTTEGFEVFVICKKNRVQFFSAFFDGWKMGVGDHHC